MRRGPLYVYVDDVDDRGRFLCFNDGRSFRYDLDHIKYDIEHGVDVRDAAEMKRAVPTTR